MKERIGMRATLERLFNHPAYNILMVCLWLLIAATADWKPLVIVASVAAGVRLLETIDRLVA
jgi:hypothetical protein